MELAEPPGTQDSWLRDARGQISALVGPGMQMLYEGQAQAN